MPLRPYLQRCYAATTISRLRNEVGVEIDQVEVRVASKRRR